MKSKSLRFIFALLACMTALALGIANAEVVKKPAEGQAQATNIELVKSGDSPHLTIFYFGELQGWFTPCG